MLISVGKEHINLLTGESAYSVVSVKTAKEFSHHGDLDEKRKDKKKRIEIRYYYE